MGYIINLIIVIITIGALWVLYKKGGEIKLTETIHIKAWKFYITIACAFGIGLWLPW